ncbi:MAG: hypothetical protein V3U99_04325 [Alphaproteobacteria bacterium]
MKSCDGLRFVFTTVLPSRKDSNGDLVHDDGAQVNLRCTLPRHRCFAFWFPPNLGAAVGAVMSPHTHSGAVIEDVEALVYGYGIPPEPALTEVRRAWWRLRRQGVLLPTERRDILVEGTFT